MENACSIIVVILIIIILFVAIFAVIYNQRNSPFNMNFFRSKNLNQHKNHFSSSAPNAVSPLAIKPKDAVIDGSTSAANMPSQFLPKNAANRAAIANNIQNLQGKVDKDYYGKFFQSGGSALPPDTKCYGYGSDAVCVSGGAPATTAPATTASAPTATGVANASNFNSLYGNSTGNPFNATYGSNVYGNISDGNSMLIPMEKIADAEQELWMAYDLSAGQVALDNLDLAGLGLLAQPMLDYDSYLDSLVIDDRMLSNHSNWVNEMLPWAGTAQMVDTIDEALVNSLDWRGLRRPQAVTQDSNSLFQTEIGASDLIGHPKFSFNQ